MADLGQLLPKVILAPRTNEDRELPSRVMSTTYRNSISENKELEMLTLFGSMAAGIMFLSNWLEPRSKWFVLAFAGASAATSLYSALAGVYPITGIEALWAGVALQRFSRRNREELAVC